MGEVKLSNVTELFCNETITSSCVSNFSDPNQVNTTDPIVNRVVGVISIFMTLIGLIGNTLIIIVLRTQASSSTHAYFIGLACSDIIVNIVTGSTTIAINLWDVFIPDEGVAFCKFWYVLLYGCIPTSSWILVAVTLERVISVTSPFHVKRICSVRVSKVAIVMIFVLIYGANSHYFLSMEYVDKMCMGSSYVYSDVTFFVEVAYTFVIPFVIICSSNVIIVYKLSRRIMSHKKADSNASLTRTLVAVCIAYLLTYSPIYLLDILRLFGVEMPMALDKFYPVFILLMNMNGCINFPLYFLTGSKFREALFQLLPFRRTSSIEKRTTLAVLSDSTGNSSGQT